MSRREAGETFLKIDDDEGRDFIQDCDWHNYILRIVKMIFARLAWLLNIHRAIFLERNIPAALRRALSCRPLFR
ncbi:hypothetical protein NCH01_30010 [Neoasaia chiangmaiensis]|nr:hypothetical protein NCH01_30010 [Neoasaia chiangmaiensis]